MSKCTFKFVFPKKSMEYEALANPYHAEAAAAVALSEQDTDMVMVYFQETLQFVCIYDGANYDKPFKYYYEDKTKQVEVFILNHRKAVECYRDNGSDIDAIKKVINECDIYKEHLMNYYFSSEEAKDAFVKGFYEAMVAAGSEDEFAFLEEWEYDMLLESAKD